MSQKIDFNALRARTMGSGNDEEAVTVDTRGLISKVLARYSGKWTVLREMIQNAADANATKVTIRFETLPSTTVPLPSAADESTLIKHTISNHTLRRLLISNNGLPFSEKDWARLKRIADGNPDETKIGAFGVGFYSVFDDCEEPFVSSGKDAMAFYWKGNALFTRRLQLNEDANPETTFVLDYRNDTSPIPSLMQLCQFLSSSLTFVSLEGIELWLDDWNLLRLSKKTAPSINLTIPREIETKTSQGLMKIQNVTREVAQVDALWMRVVEWNPNASIFREGLRDTTGSLRTFFSRLTGQNGAESPVKPEKQDRSSDPTGDMTKTINASVFLHINTATIQASVSQSLSSELERATRKPPPKKSTIAVLTPSYDTTLASGASGLQSEVLSSILPSKSGRIFIGFPTHQTTGLNAHISAPSVIPTVERESIDLNTRYISKWNQEMLRAAGIVCRIAWTAEMASITAKILSGREPSKSTKIRKDDIVGVLPEAVHTANQFVFRESTPSSLLGQTIEDAFWTCNKSSSIEVLSTCGVIQSHQARLAPKDLSFMDSIPVLPDEFVSGAKDFVKKLTDFGLVTDVTVSDIKRELESGTLRSSQVIEFLAWLGRRAASGQLDLYSVQSLLSVAVASDEDDSGRQTKLIVFAGISSYLNPQKIPASLPLPPSVAPFKFTKSLGKQELEAFGWTELQIVPWVRWLVSNAGNRSLLPAEHDITQSPSFAGQVLPVLSKQWEYFSQQAKQTLVAQLQPYTVIPTRLGMKVPAETYFSSVRLFDDLPVIHGLNGVKEKFLAALGVRKTVELGVIFERLLDTAESADASSKNRTKWSHVDLIRYLASVRDDIPASDIKRLKNTSLCTAEPSNGNGSGDLKGANRKRYKIFELFEPKDSFRALGLPIIEWPGKYQPSSNEGKFLSTLGLRSFPSAAELVQIMAKAAAESHWTLHTKAMAYYIAEYHTSGYATFDCGAATVPFLPVEGSGGLTVPSKCFTDEGATLFGFEILRRDLHPHAPKFGVKQHPGLSDCIDSLLRQPPSTKRDARVLFKYLAGRVSELSARDIDRVGGAQVVPVSTTSDATEKKSIVRRVTPKLCYLGEGEDYKDIFDFVDFGQEANLFLMAVGSKREPTKVELARMLVKEPARISATFQSADKYLKLLRTLAEHVSVLKRDRELFQEMKRSAFLLASRDITTLAQATAAKDGPNASDDEEEDSSIKEWTLTAAHDAVVVDDFQSFNLFKEHVLAAPQEELLENFYQSLGALPLSGLVEERAHWGAVAADQRPAAKLQKLIRERSRLYLHDQSPDLIRHDVRWLEKHLQVQVVHSISLTRSLKGRRISHTQKRSAIITQQARDWILWICPGKYDLYEISQALVHLILVRPKLHSTLTLEMLLKTDLLELKARGYNVERILKQKAQEARMAEDRRQKQVEEERQQLQEREAAWAREQAQAQAQAQAPPTENEQLMPGDFPKSPAGKNASRDVQAEGPEPAPDRRPRGFFANLSKRFGLEGNRSPWNAVNGESSQPALPESSETATPPPPPYSAEDPQKNPQEPRPEAPVNVGSPHRLQTELLSAIQACRPHGSSDVYSRPEANQISENKSYCDEKPSHDLEFVATLACGMNVLFVRTLPDRTSFLSKNSVGINVFASMLMDCAQVFSLRSDILSIFYDPGGKTIAFNRAGSVFCNYFYFQQLHEKELLANPTADRADALVYWWVILCHELAHNLVADHSSAHSYYTYVSFPASFSSSQRALSNSCAARALLRSTSRR
ncbi:HATPase domain protein [Aspergillus heteromorphus CBS 117.55]|uniref:HATPase domain protein n=1 Tax=Aspergillus heteromorphus CBS 117.55 TaxID=1448321 RepID=A0A317W8U2_9EURO|nr:HATPase domain protein [Aspergillus heteromorphus CBS 117.55]PWY83026.1 HATPase domain protein [Aspergillus heteromorphus CBS 117.55]